MVQIMQGVSQFPQLLIIFYALGADELLLP